MSTRGNTRLLVAAALALAALGAAWWLAPCAPDSALADAVGEGAGAAADTPDARLAAPTREEVAAPADHAPAAREAVEATAAVDAGVQPAAAASGTLAGRVVVRDAAGVPHESEDGWLQLAMSSPRSAEQRHPRIDVVGGRFELDGDASEQIDWIEHAYLGGRYASNLEFDDHALEEPLANGEVLVLELEWSPPTVLRVLDAATSEDLHGLEFRAAGFGEGSGLGDGFYSYPSETTWSVTLPTSSPVSLDALAGQASDAEGNLFVRAPGSEWGRVLVSLWSGGEWAVELARGAELEVELLGEALPEDACLRIWRDPGQEPWAELALHPPRPLLLEGLPAGPAEVRVERGPLYRSIWKHDDARGGPEPLVLAAGSVTLVAGERRRVVLEVRVPELGAPAPLAGTLHLPIGWSRDGVHLSLRRLGPSGPDWQRTREIELGAGGFAAFRGDFEWDAGAVPPGRYVLELNEPSVPFEVDVPPDGKTDVRLAVGAPGDLVLRFVDAETERPVHPPVVMAGVPSNGAGLGVVEWQLLPPSSDSITLRVPRGELQVFVGARREAPLYAGWTERFVVGARRVERTVLLERVQALLLRVRAGNRDLFDIERAAVLAPVDHGGRQLDPLPGPEGCLHGVSAPGPYRLRLEPIPGFRPPEEREVEIPRHGLAELVIELERIP